MNISKRDALKLFTAWVLVSGLGLTGFFVWSLLFPHITPLRWPSDNSFWFVFAGRAVGAITFVLSGGYVGLVVSRRLGLMLISHENPRV